jgi:hypothetical protein
MKRVDPPFELGETLSGTNDSGTLTNDDKLGQIFEIPAQNLGGGNFASGNKARLSGRSIIAVMLRNTSGGVLLGKRIGILDEVTAGYGLLETCSGYSDTLAQRNVVVVDDKLPSGGVADDDIFWGILQGPTTVLTPHVEADFNGIISIGDPLVSSTATTTGATTAGRLSNVTVVGQTGGTQAFTMGRGVVATALSAATTGNTNSDLLVNACIQY